MLAAGLSETCRRRGGAKGRTMDKMKAAAVEAANKVVGFLDGTMAPISKIMAENEVVFAVWQDAREDDGVGIKLVKGRKRLEALAAAEQPAPAGAEIGRESWRERVCPDG